MRDGYTERAMHAQKMMSARSNGDGFRRIHEHSNQVSLVERYLILAGDMKEPPLVPDDRRYRQKRRPLSPRTQRRHDAAVARGKGEKPVVLRPERKRGLSLEPNDHLVEQTSDAFKDVKSPAEFVQRIIRRLGIRSVAEYDRLAVRVERFERSAARDPRKRVPGHLREPLVLKRIIERVIALRWPSAATA